LRRKHHHSEAETHRQDEQCLLAHILAGIDYGLSCFGCSL
jgi:hypothetical protein